MTPLEVRCPECWAVVGIPNCPCGQTTILKRDLHRLGEMLHDAERRAAHWRERALQSEASTNAEEGT